MSSDKKTHGVVDHLQRRTDYLFRISMKSLICNERGEVLVVKEAGRSWWDLPGGGIDHEESLKNAIARELREEVNLRGDFTYQVIAVEEPALLEHAGVWQMRLIFEVEPLNMLFEPGLDSDEVCFIDPRELKDSSISAERRVYEYWQIAMNQRD